MTIVRFQLIAIAAVFLVPVGAEAHCGGKHTGDHPHCADSGGGDGGGDIALNEFRVRWVGSAVLYTGAPPPRTRHLISDPQPNGMHTPYGSIETPAHTIEVNPTGGAAVKAKGSDPSPEDILACANGFDIPVDPADPDPYPNN